MFHEPTRAFGMLAQRPSAWCPLLLLIVANCGLLYWYFSYVDIAWLMEKMVATIPNAAQREAAMKAMSSSLKTISVVGPVLSVPLVAALTALYFVIVGKVKNIDFGFGKGFALSLWASVPSLLMVILGSMQIALNPGGQLELSQLNPVSLNQLLFQVEMGHPWASWLDSLSVVTIWNIVLLMIGFEVWAKVSRATAAKVALIPYVVVYGVWAAINLMGNGA
jgi:hypothetical protein